ncbi:hypothetical protein BP00DRAFT_216797 [Aspergillus indologenus CBS 114.80]|uniref:Uncharacterized protein n=1 Tax=Aspergillus indologenus CBS 114.80 TaxID=1450541 RepID=A0A2V5INH0_9EURO|nr:hypothetical protein BP00DRAFT_216797 [Aspergillus indologenus CBS 114.80]
MASKRQSEQQILNPRRYKPLVERLRHAPHPGDPCGWTILSGGCISRLVSQCLTAQWYDGGSAKASRTSTGSMEGMMIGRRADGGELAHWEYFLQGFVSARQGVCSYQSQSPMLLWWSNVHKKTLLRMLMIILYNRSHIHKPGEDSPQRTKDPTVVCC